MALNNPYPCPAKPCTSPTPARHRSLYANEPKNLRLVEDLLSLKVTAREDWINLEGEAPDVEAGKMLFAELQHAIVQGATVHRQEFSQAVSSVSRGERPSLSELNKAASKFHLTSVPWPQDVGAETLH